MTRLTRRVFPAVVLSAGCGFVFPALLGAQEYTIKLVASGLAQPTGIALDDDFLYFTEVPTPGVAGGMNAVKKLDLEDGTITTLHMGEPQPVNIAIARDGSVYWT